MPHDPDSISSNPTDNAALADLVASRLSRRRVLTGGLGAAAVTFFGGSPFGGAARAAGATSRRADTLGHLATRPVTRPPTGSPLGFTAVAASTEDAVVVPEGYTAQVLIPW